MRAPARAVPAAPVRLLTTAAHTAPPTAGARQPWGRAHARSDGSHWTLCGLPTATWVTFWHVPFGSADVDLCDSCVTVARAPRDVAEAALG